MRSLFFNLFHPLFISFYPLLTQPSRRVGGCDCSETACEVATCWRDLIHVSFEHFFTSNVWTWRPTPQTQTTDPSILISVFHSLILAVWERWSSTLVNVLQPSLGFLLKKISLWTSWRSHGWQIWAPCGWISQPSKVLTWTTLPWKCVILILLNLFLSFSSVSWFGTMSLKNKTRIRSVV